MNESAFVIRRADLDDAETISHLLIAVSERYVLPDLSETGAQHFLGELKVETIREKLRSGFVFHVAEADGTLAGVAAMSSTTHLYFLFVDTPFQRRGLARRLLFEATADWRAADTTEPLKVNASRFAVPAYRRLGFEPAGEREVRHGVAYYPMQKKHPDS